MELNLSKNVYNVGPVGDMVIIGRSAALKAGLMHEQVVNLAAWLVLAGQVSKEELEEALSEIVTPAFTDPIVDQVSSMQDAEMPGIPLSQVVEPTTPRKMFVSMGKNGTATVTGHEGPVTISSGRHDSPPAMPHISIGPNAGKSHTETMMPTGNTPAKVLDHEALVRKWRGVKDNG
jgi:hypothetical protein